MLSVTGANMLNPYEWIMSNSGTFASSLFMAVGILSLLFLPYLYKILCTQTKENGSNPWWAKAEPVVDVYLHVLAFGPFFFMAGLPIWYFFFR